MRKFLGLIFVIVGSLIILGNFFPDYTTYLEGLSAVTQVPFWGVILVMAGGYFLVKNENAKTGIGVLLVLFVVIYLLGATAGSPTFEVWGWSVSTLLGGDEKIEADVRSIGSYGGTEMEIKNIAADIRFTDASGGKTEVITNLPVSADKSGDGLLLHCTGDCKKFKNGELTLKVGRNQNLEGLVVRDTVGNISLNLSKHLKNLTVSDFVGRLEAEGLAVEKMEVRDFIGDLALGISYMGQFEGKNGIGDIKLTLPEDYRVELTSESLLSKIDSQGEIHQGTRSVKFGINNVIGQVTLRKLSPE
ncbi:MAG: hypothetical protein ACLFN7_06020 [Candidatus Acetothermia bacterium]